MQGVGSTLEPLAGVGTLVGAVYTCCLVVLVLTQPLPSSSTPPITLTHPPNAAPTRSSSMSEQQGTTNPWPSSASRLPCPMISASMRSCSASSAASCARAKGATGTGRVKSVRYMQNVGSLFSGKVQRHSCMKQPRPHQNLAQRPPRMQEGRAGPANHECTPAKACRASSVAPAVCAPAFVHDHPSTVTRATVCMLAAALNVLGCASSLYSAGASFMPGISSWESVFLDCLILLATSQGPSSCASSPAAKPQHICRGQRLCRRCITRCQATGSMG